MRTNTIEKNLNFFAINRRSSAGGLKEFIPLDLECKVLYIVITTREEGQTIFVGRTNKL
jgi:hypothetical protein